MVYNWEERVLRLRRGQTWSDRECHVWHKMQPISKFTSKNINATYMKPRFLDFVRDT